MDNWWYMIILSDNICLLLGESHESCFPIAFFVTWTWTKTQCSSHRGWAIHWKKAGWVNWLHDISWSDSSRKFWNGFQKHSLAEARLARYNWWYLFIDLFSNEICYGESRTDIFIILQLDVVCPHSSQVQPQTTGFLHQNGSKMRWDAGRRPDHVFFALSRIIQVFEKARDETRQRIASRVEFSGFLAKMKHVSRC